MIGFFSLVEQKLSMRGRATDSDSEMIHEMLRRGFAVMRMPEPPDAVG